MDKFSTQEGSLNCKNINKCGKKWKLKYGIVASTFKLISWAIWFHKFRQRPKFAKLNCRKIVNLTLTVTVSFSFSQSYKCPQNSNIPIHKIKLWQKLNQVDTFMWIIYTLCGRFMHHVARAVASLTVPGGQEFNFPHFFVKFQSIFLIFPQTLLVVFLILALWVGESPTREGPGYATACSTEGVWSCSIW